jgi:transposase
MAYRTGENVHQMMLLPQSLDEYVSQDHPVRAYDAFVNALDFHELGIELNDRKVGNSEYDPRLMLKLLLFGYSYGVKSSRKLERETHNNMAFIWLIRKLTPDHKTISEFRRKNKPALKKAMHLCARLCMKLDLIDGNVLFVDGTKIRANAGRGKSHKQAWYLRKLEELDKRIEELLQECETIDHQEEDYGSFVKMQKELSNSRKLKDRVSSILQDFQEKGARTPKGKDRKVNLTDTESKIMSSVQGSHTSYNVQSVVDDKNGLIVETDAVTEGSDVNQFAHQIVQAEKVLDRECEIACADAGYADTEELEKIDQRGTQVIVPSQRQASHTPEKPFSKRAFTYDHKSDCYFCPEGHKLRYAGRQAGGRKLDYLITDAAICKRCTHYGTCTTAKKGRKIVRLANEETKEKLEHQYEQPDSQEVYARRKQRAEHPFGHIKRNLGFTNFSLRGREGARAEISIPAICFNIARMITIFGGVQKMITRLSAVKV